MLHGSQTIPCCERETASKCADVETGEAVVRDMKAPRRGTAKGRYAITLGLAPMASSKTVSAKAKGQLTLAMAITWERGLFYILCNLRQMELPAVLAPSS